MADTNYQFRDCGSKLLAITKEIERKQMAPLEWHNETRKISELVPHAKNPRRLTEEQKQTLTDSLEKFNLVEIPVINTDNTILAGHQRLKVLAALGRGDEEIEVRVPNRELTQPEADEYLLRSNKNTGEWDYDLLKAFDADALLSFGFQDYEIKSDRDETLAQYEATGDEPSKKDSLPEDERPVNWSIDTTPEYGMKLRNWMADHQGQGVDDGDTLWLGIKDYEGAESWNKTN